MPELREKLDSVSSQSVKLHLTPRRADQTEVTVDDDRATIQFETGTDTQKRKAVLGPSAERRVGFNDTIKQPAFDSSKIIVDGGSDIPIYVTAGAGGSTGKANTLQSGFHAAFPGSDRHASDSQRATLPHTSATGASGARPASVGRWAAVLVLMAVVAAVAFWLGRVLH